MLVLLQRVLERESVIRLSQKDAHKILALLDHPPKPNRLGRLAVAKAYQRQGIRKILLVAAIGKLIEIYNTAGGIGLFVDAVSVGGALDHASGRRG